MQIVGCSAIPEPRQYDSCGRRTRIARHEVSPVPARESAPGEVLVVSNGLIAAIPECDLRGGYVCVNRLPVEVYNKP
jgi:hypothetical protein